MAPNHSEHSTLTLQESLCKDSVSCPHAAEAFPDSFVRVYVTRLTASPPGLVTPNSRTPLLINIRNRRCPRITLLGGDGSGRSKPPLETPSPTDFAKDLVCLAGVRATHRHGHRGSLDDSFSVLFSSDLHPNATHSQVASLACSGTPSVPDDKLRPAFPLNGK